MLIFCKFLLHFLTCIIIIIALFNSQQIKYILLKLAAMVKLFV